MKKKRTAGRRNADFSTVPEGRRPDKKRSAGTRSQPRHGAVQGGLGRDCVKTLCKRSFLWYNRAKGNEREEMGWNIFQG